MIRIACSQADSWLLSLSGAAATAGAAGAAAPSTPVGASSSSLLWSSASGSITCCASWKHSTPISRRRFASGRNSRCSTSFQSMKRQPAARCCGLSAFCAAVCTNESSSCRSTDVLESRLARSKLDSASKKNAAKCLATSLRIELLKERMYARSSGCVYHVKFRNTQHSLMCGRVSRMMLRSSVATCCGAQSRTESQGISSASPRRACMSVDHVEESVGEWVTS